MAHSLRESKDLAPIQPQSYLSLPPTFAMSYVLTIILFPSEEQSANSMTGMLNWDEDLGSWC